MIRLSAFADEISSDLNEQIAVLQSEDIYFLDLRGVWNTNVLDLTNEQVTEIQRTLAEHAISVAAIGSPLGKVPIDSPFEPHLQLLDRAIELAGIFNTPFIRIFSFYPPTTGETEPAFWRPAVHARLTQMVARAQSAGVILIHENEKDIYGDTIARCQDLMQHHAGPGFQSVFDPANFIQSGQTPYPDAYEALRPWIGYVHVKDALSDGTVVPAGEGISHWPEIISRLRADNYDGFFSLEPHLALSGHYGGFTGPELFRVAVQRLRALL